MSLSQDQGSDVNHESDATGSTDVGTSTDVSGTDVDSFGFQFERDRIVRARATSSVTARGIEWSSPALQGLADQASTTSTDVSGAEGDFFGFHADRDRGRKARAVSSNVARSNEEDSDQGSREESGPDVEHGRSTLTEELMRRCRDGSSPLTECEELFHEWNPIILQQLQKRAALLDSRELGLQALKEQLLIQARRDALALEAERESFNTQMDSQRQRLDGQMADIEERLGHLQQQIKVADERTKQLAVDEEELFQREKELCHREQEFLSRVQGKDFALSTDRNPSPLDLSESYVYTYSEDVLEVVAISLLIIAGLTTGVICFLLKSILVPFLFSVILMYLFKPLVDFVSQPCGVFSCCCPPYRTAENRASGVCDRVRRCQCVFIPRWCATLCAILFCLAILGALGFTIARSFQNLQDMRDKYLHGAVILATKLQWVLQMLDVDLQEGVMPQITTFLHQFILRVVDAASGYASQLFIVLVFLAFLLLAPINRTSPLDSYSGPTSCKMKPKPLDKINIQVKKYIQIKTIISLMVGVLVWLIWNHFGVDCALILALLTGLATYIPTLGPFVATFFPLPLVLLNPDLSLTAQVLSLLLPLFIHSCVGNFVEPMILANKFELHPVTVLLSVAFWGYLWDMAGLILAVPIVVALQIVLANITYPPAQAASQLLAGQLRPASPFKAD